MKEKPRLANQRYELVSILGSGGMASVFRAYDTRLKVERAIKVLAPQLTHRKAVRSRFETEATTMANLHHKNIVTVHDIGNEGNVVYMVMEMLHGGSLMDRVESHGSLHPQQAIQAAIAMATGLGYAHDKNVVHRDVKPHNVLISDKGALKMADFGIARIEDGSSSNTTTGAMMGTLAYMAPEQRLSARRADSKSDLYAVAASFFAILTQYNPLELYSTEVQDDLLKDLHPKIQEFIRRGCHFNPMERFQNSDKMIEALEQLSEELEPLSSDVKPLFIPHTSQKLSEDMTDEEIHSLNTLWDSIHVGSNDQYAQVLDNREIKSNQTLDLDIGLLETDFNDEHTTDVHVIKNNRDSTNQSLTPSPIPPLAEKEKSPVMSMIVIVAITLALGFGIAKWTTPPAVPVAESPAVLTPEPEPIQTKPTNALNDPPKAPPVESSPKDTSPEKKESAEVVPSPPQKKTTTATPPPKKPAKPKGKGTVMFNIRPYGSVQINGEKHKTPFTGELPSGKYKLSFTSFDGQEHKANVYVKPNKRTEYCWDYELSTKCPL